LIPPSNAYPHDENGAVAVLDPSVVRGAAMSVYQPLEQVGVGGRLFVRTAGDPHAVVPAVERVIRELAADQPVERAATLQDVRAEILSSDARRTFGDQREASAQKAALAGTG
jgi:hypothetical protein